MKFAPAADPFFNYYKKVGRRRGQIVKFHEPFRNFGPQAGGKPGGKSKRAGGKLWNSARLLVITGANSNIFVRGTRVEPYHDKTCSSAFQKHSRSSCVFGDGSRTIGDSFSPLIGSRRVCKQGHATTASRKCSWITLRGFFSQWSALNAHKFLADRSNVAITALLAKVYL